MRTRWNIFLTVTISAILFASVYSGCGDPEPGQEEETPAGLEEEVGEQDRITGRIIRPEHNSRFVVGEPVEIELDFDEEAPAPARLTLFVDGREMDAKTVSGTRLVWESGMTRTGNRRIRVRVEFENGITAQYSTRIVFTSDIEPANHSYRILNTYPHDINAFTQGLVYDGRHLYESTGQYGKSTLRRVDPETGDVLQSASLERDFFGEGLALLNDKLYQLTWKEGVGFIYEKDSFQLLGRFRFPTEGWGLTTDGEYLLKTDGSDNVYVYDTVNLSEVDRFQVYDMNGPVTGLNEMEYKEGLIYANVFDTEKIVIFERGTGRVRGWLDLSGILEEEHHHPGLDVMNGIAYNPHNGTFFVTGKNWPLLFEIEILKRE